MRVLVTGASGFAGTALTRILVQTGMTVRAAVRNLASATNLPDNAEPAVLPDLSAPFDWAPFLTGMDAIIHLAGIAHAGGAFPEHHYDRVNHAATAELAVAAARQKIGRLIFISSIRAQSGPSAEHILHETDEPRPTDAYGRSKLAAEQAVRTSGVAYTIFRPVVMYGEGVKGNLAVLQRLAATSWPLPFGALRARRSLLAVENLASAILFALREPRTENETYIVADRSPFSLAEIVTIMCAANKRPANLLPVPASVLALGLTISGRGDLWERLGGGLVADPYKLLSAGWQPAVETRPALAAWVQAASKSGTASRSTR
jgi:UDP-glucose 4-epimerase